MLAARRSIKFNGQEFRTPILIPSFSSKGFADVDKIIGTCSEFITAETLVSAYDIYYKKIKPPFLFPSLIFLDSGGYEASKDVDLSDFGEREYFAKEWDQEKHEKVLEAWKSEVPTVFIGYDHPKERLAIPEQIKRAKKMAPNRTDILREILLKPDKKDKAQLPVPEVLKHVKKLEGFDVIGVTEKEIGNSILARMKNIALIRRALSKAGLNTPIHVFGSLDTITTCMYFTAGADIFDGLTWLRFAYHEGNTIYKHNYGALELGIGTLAHVIDGRCWANNYYYLENLRLEMGRFLSEGDFSSFQFNSKEMKKAYQSLIEEIGGENGR